MKRRHFNYFLAAAALPLAGCEKSQIIEGGFTGVHIERGHVLRASKPRVTPGKTLKTKVIIAGGGVAGLAAARALRLQGMNDFVMLELEDRAGGNSKAVRSTGSPAR